MTAGTTRTSWIRTMARYSFLSLVILLLSLAGCNGEDNGQDGGRVNGPDEGLPPPGDNADSGDTTPDTDAPPEEDCDNESAASLLKGISFRAAEYSFSIGEDGESLVAVSIRNQSVCPRTLEAFHVINPNRGIRAEVQEELPMIIQGGESVHLHLKLATVGPVGDEIQMTAALKSADSPEEQMAGLTLHVGDNGGTVLPDLAVFSGDLAVPDGDIPVGEDTEVGFTIHNLGAVEANEVTVVLMINGEDQRSMIIPEIAPGEERTESLSAVFSEPGMYLVQIIIDPANTIHEMSTSNNSAMRTVRVGGYAGSATIQVSASSRVTCLGDWTNISGQATYLLTTARGEFEFQVQGAKVEVTIGETGASYSGSHSRTSGRFHQPIWAPDEEGWYTLQITVSDGTVHGVAQIPLQVDGECETPLPEEDLRDDIFVRAEGISFSPEEGVEVGDILTANARVHYRGTTPRVDIPVSFYVHVPVGQVLMEQFLGRTIVSFPNGDLDSPALVNVRWRIRQTGPQVFQVVTSPDFDQNPHNDAATRLLIVQDEFDEHIDICDYLLCEDHNDCTAKLCDPDVGCYFPPVPDGEPCSDYFGDHGMCAMGECLPFTCSGSDCPPQTRVLTAFNHFREGDGRLPTTATAENRDNPMSRESGFPANQYQYPRSIPGSLGTGHWHSGRDTKYWVVRVNTVGHFNLRVSSQQRSSPLAGPRDFKIQCSPDGNRWLDTDNNGLVVGDDFFQGDVTGLPLHVDCEDQPNAAVRWIVSSNTSVNGGRVTAPGNSNIRHVSIIGDYYPSNTP